MEKPEKKTRNRLTKAQSTLVCQIFSENDGKWDKVLMFDDDYYLSIDYDG